MNEIKSQEQELVRVRAHWITLVRDIAIVVLVSIGPFLVFPLFLSGIFSLVLGDYGALVPIVGFLWILTTWIALGVVWTNYLLSHVLVTDKQIVHVDQTALFSRSIRTWRLDRIAEISIEKKGPLETGLNYGVLAIRAEGEQTPSTIAYVPNPEHVRNAIFENVSSLSKLAATNADQEKLLHTISHEVKAHLTKDAAALASIAEGDYGGANEQMRKMAGEALTETRKGVSMVTDLLKASNFKTGTVAFDKKTFDLKAAVKSVIDELRPDAAHKRLLLELAAPDGTYTIAGDEKKIRDHIVRNLIDNAIRYTPQGSVRVALTRVESLIVLMVADTGIGITESDRARLFTEGGKGAKSTATNPSSTGYGLFIAKSVVEAHGGRIWAESEGQGKGAQFYACFPAV